MLVQVACAVVGYVGVGIYGMGLGYTAGLDKTKERKIQDEFRFLFVEWESERGVWYNSMGGMYIDRVGGVESR